MSIKYEHTLTEWLALHSNQFAPIVPFDAAADHLLELDFTAANNSLTAELLKDTGRFSQWVNAQLQTAGARYGYGGYNEHRTVYSRSSFFSDPQGGEPRRLHLGMDIWGAAGTPVMAPLGGIMHSFAFNNNPSDYGATIILSHQLDGRQFYTLYGHLSLADLQAANEGNYIVAGQVFAHFGEPHENGNWPPHLHFQVIEDIGLKEGDYPGVCRFSEREKMLANCPDPDLLIQWKPLLGRKPSKH
jgi:murein DD-endopeptidase MepM/ murein hydrolase activator NlpD